MPGMRAVGLSIALTANHEFNGPVMVTPGSHRWFVSCGGETPEQHYEQSLRRQRLGVPDDEILGELVQRGGIRALEAPAGYALLFDSNLVHGSNGNVTPFPRSNLFMVFNSVENRLERPWSRQAPRPEYVAHRRDMAPLVRA